MTSNCRALLYFFLVVTLAACGAGAGGGVNDFTRVTDPASCSKAKADAQNIIIQWAKDRQKEGRPVSPNTAAALLDLARFESGGSRGMSFANITSHGNEGNTNKAGWNGEVKATSGQVEGFLNRYSASHESNFGALQISPNVIINYRQESSFKNFANSVSNPSQLYQRCISDLAYKDGANVMSHLSELWTERGTMDAKFKAMKRFNSSGQSACRNNPECNKAAEYFGRWLTYCPRLNLDMAQVVFNSPKRAAYFGALRKTGRNPGICKDLIAQELRGEPAIVESPPQLHGDADGRMI